MNAIPKTALIATAAVGTILSGASHADPYLLDVATQLVAVADGENVTYTHNGELRDGWHDDLTVFLERGMSYRFYGACDRDCNDLDLELFDRNGQRIDYDVEPDDYPIISKWSGFPAFSRFGVWEPVYGGREGAYYTLRVSMVSCDVDPCTYGVVAVAE